jgi:hypothetical protein
MYGTADLIYAIADLWLYGKDRMTTPFALKAVAFGVSPTYLETY